MDKAVHVLKDQYAGETVWIVGKGPSLEYLCAEHFGKGPVITINEAILIVQDLELPNPLYSMQKDGHEGVMVRPHDDVTLILQENYAGQWFEDHPLRLGVDPIEDLGFASTTEMSIRMCIALGRVMGCGEIAFLCCDSLSSPDMRTYDVRTGNVIKISNYGYYSHVVPLVKSDVKNIRHRYIVPRASA